MTTALPRFLRALTVCAVLVGGVALPLAAAPPAVAAGTGTVTVARMTADSERNPLGVDVARPRLAWTLRSQTRGEAQSAYRVIVASSPSMLADDHGDVWDSGKVDSAESTGIAYGGPALRSAQRYWWKVRVWDREGRPSPWSGPAHWEMGLLSDADWDGARWINGPTKRIESDGVVATDWGFDTAGDAEGWKATNDFADFRVADGQLSTEVTGPDPFMLSPAVHLDGSSDRLLRVRLRASEGSGMSVYFVTDESPGWSEAKKVSFPIQGDGQFHEYLVDMGDENANWRGTVTGLRLDLDGASPGSELSLDRVSIEHGRTVHLGDPLLRRDFAVDKQVERARAYVSGLGYYVLSIDGKRIGDRVLDPGFTVYDKTALYSTYDVTSAVREQGAHALGVSLGRGFYGLSPGDTKYWGSAPWLGDPRVRLELRIDYADGSHATVVSDDSWQVHGGPTTHDSVYLGEDYDARLAQPGWNRTGFDAAGWRPASEVAAPTSTLRSERMQPIRVVATERAERITNPRPGTYVFRFPTVTAGWARLRVTGPRGAQVTLRYGETLRSDGTVDNDGDPGLTNGPIQTDRYTLSGDGEETWEPSFSYNGFQYVQVDGYPGTPTADDVVARVVHSDVGSTGRFSSSNGLLNTIHAMTRRTVLNNLHSIFTDTPEFEKRGWLGDTNVLIPTAIDNFAMRRFYRNWMTDITDNQGPDGAGVELSPNPFPAGYTDPIWAGALVDIPWALYRDYGDRDVLASDYDAMARYVDYLAAHSDGLIQQGFYGDWVAPATSGTFPWPPEGPKLTATAYFYRYADVMAQAAEVLHRSDDAARFRSLAEQIKGAFNARFLDRERGVYRTDVEAGYRQTSNAVPLTFGLVPADLVDKVTRNLVADVRAHGNHLNTGHAGTKELLPALTEQGHVDTAFAIATQRSYPSWGYWIENGATTLWENWELNARSHDHAFLGTIDDWFYRYLAGIKPAAPGYARIAIRPYLPSGLHRASASVDTVRGTVASGWSRSPDGSISLEVTIPTNATAEVAVPAASPDVVTEGDGPAAAADGVRFLRMDGDRAVFEVGSGRYQFRTTP